MKRFGWFLAVFLFASVLPCDARIVIQKKGRAQLALPADDPMALSDTIRVILRVEGSPNMVVDAAGEMPAGSAWTLVQRGPPFRETIGPNKESWSIHYFFAPRKPGAKVEFTFPPVKYRADKEEHTVVFAPVFYTVTTQIKEADLAQLHDITAIEPLPPIEPPDHAWVWWTVLAGSCFLVIGLVLVMRRWLRRRALRSPAQLAMHEWSRLIAMKLPEKGRSERFITLLTTLVRRYLERQFALPARRQTTPELLHQLAQTAALAPAEKQFLSSFLERCETVKFANAAMAPDECRQWAGAARQFLQGRASG